jgi:hypothetical protein
MAQLPTQALSQQRIWKPASGSEVFYQVAPVITDIIFSMSVDFLIFYSLLKALIGNQNLTNAPLILCSVELWDDLSRYIGLKAFLLPAVRFLHAEHVVHLLMQIQAHPLVWLHLQTPTFKNPLAYVVIF